MRPKTKRFYVARMGENSYLNIAGMTRMMIDDAHHFDDRDDPKLLRWVREDGAEIVRVTIEEKVIQPRKRARA